MLRCGLLSGLTGCCFVALRLHDLPPSDFVGDGLCRHCQKPRVARAAAERVLSGARWRLILTATLCWQRKSSGNVRKDRFASEVAICGRGSDEHPMASA